MNPDITNGQKKRLIRLMFGRMARHAARRLVDRWAAEGLTYQAAFDRAMAVRASKRR